MLKRKIIARAAIGGCRLWGLIWAFPVIVLAGEPAPQPGPAAPPMTDIHDIKPLMAVSGSLPWKAILIGVLVLALIAAAVLYWRYLRKSMTVTDVVAELPPEVTAGRALDQIADVTGIDGKTFYFSLSAILRQYLRDRYGMNAPEMTTEELLPQLGTLELTPELFEGLARLCQGADPIKYANERPQLRQMELDVAFARKFVDGTTPREIDADESPDALNVR